MLSATDGKGGGTPVSAEQVGGTPGSAAVSDRMRALLARAAEEQLLEQRQVSTVLGELRALVEDVDERLATGEQVDRVATEVRALSARVEAAQARSNELAERTIEATALVGRAAQDLVDAVETQLREATASLTASVESSERRLATHVDDAVLALAEVVLRRRSGAVTAPPPSPAAAGEDGPPPPAAGDDGPPPPVDTPTPVDAAAPDGTAGPLLVDPDTDGLVPASGDGPPGDGFVLVPADVEEPDAAPAPPVPHERRTAERRTSERGDGSGRRRRPWWRPA
jgi:hypothetical protein